MKRKSRAARLERKARPRSGSPKSIADSIDALDIFTVVVFVTGIVVAAAVTVIVARTMVLTGLAAVAMQRRALSPIASTSTNMDAGIDDGLTDAAGTFMRGISPCGPAPMFGPALTMITLSQMTVPTTGGGAAAERAARSAARDAKASAGVRVKRESRAARPARSPGERRGP